MIETWQTILTFVDLEDNQIILRGLAQPDIHWSIYYRHSIIKTVWILQKNGINQWNKTLRSRNRSIYLYKSLFMTKLAEA